MNSVHIVWGISYSVCIEILLGCCFLTSLLHVTLERTKEHKQGLGFGGKHQLLVYADIKFIAICTHCKQDYRIIIGTIPLCYNIVTVYNGSDTTYINQQLLKVKILTKILTFRSF